jgi:ABC-type transport system substrate-binding protein
MRQFDWRSVVVSSVLLGALVANAETRPQYGGTLHVTMRAALMTLDPAEFDPAWPESVGRHAVSRLMFDTLVTLDQNLRIQPGLAMAWQAEAGNEHWQLRIRPGVKFHDGTALSAEVAAASLRAANPGWTVNAEGDSVAIVRDSPDLELLAELALPRNAIVKRNPNKAVSGTGPFHVVDWQPGKKLVLAAEESSWCGRPFVDAIEIEMGKSFHEQMTAMESGKADLVEVAPEQAHHVSQERHRIANSKPMELIVLLFTREATTSAEKLLREALARSVERGSIHSVLLQGAGQPAASLLPNWMSGYGFVFPSDADLTRARQAREQVRSVPSWTVGYDGNDSMARLLAERIALNAKDAGLSLQPTTAANTDVKLTRIALASPDPWVALAELAALMGSAPGKAGGTVEDLYASERVLLTTQRMIPLFHLPVTYAGSVNLNDWGLRPDGSWNLVDAWLGTPGLATK